MATWRGAGGSFELASGPVIPIEPKATDDVSGAARSIEDPVEEREPDDASEDLADALDGPEAALSPPPSQVADFAGACVRFVAARYGTTLDYAPDTLSFVDQWLRDARAEIERRPEATKSFNRRLAPISAR